VFEEEMTYPCKGIALQQAEKNKHGVARCDCHHNEHKANAGANEMQTATSTVAVLAQVKRVKLGKATKALF